MMEDKEVGEILHKRLNELEALYSDRKGIQAFEMDMVIGLICKLVKERARSLCEDWGYCARHAEHYNEALRDFGIDPEEWPNG